MAVGLVQVGVLQLRRCRHQDVGVIGGVGLENLMDHSEQVFAQESGDDLAGIRADCDRIVVVDESRFHRRLCGGQRVAQRREVDGARLSALHSSSDWRRRATGGQVARDCHVGFYK